MESLEGEVFSLDKIISYFAFQLAILEKFMNQKIIESTFGIAIFIIVIHVVLLFLKFDQIPNVIPIHQNFKGEIDGYGSKTLLFIPMILNVIMTIIFWWCIKNVKRFNYPFSVHEGNRAKVHFYTKLVLSITLVLLSLIFGGMLIDFI